MTTTTTAQSRGRLKMTTISQYRVTADPETGEWIGDPEYVGQVDFGDWCQKEDTNEAHYDHYEHFPKDETGAEMDSETRAIEVRWAS